MKWKFLSLTHIVVIATTATISYLLVRLGQSCRSQKTTERIGYFLGSVLIANSFSYIVYRLYEGYWDVRYDLPMEFCDWAFFVTTITLFTHNKTMAELSYFWVLGGSLQAILTPNLQVDSLNLFFFLFFIGHSGLIISCLYLTFALKLTPRKGAVLRTFFYSEIYFFSAMILNFILNSNYGYLRSKPMGVSLLDFLGEWPFYLISIQALGIFSILLLYLPFLRRNASQYD